MGKEHELPYFSDLGLTKNIWCSFGVLWLIFTGDLCAKWYAMKCEVYSIALLPEFLVIISVDLYIFRLASRDTFLM